MTSPRRTDHADVEELLGAYALDAVEPAEAALVERHLEDCPRCRGEVLAHRETAAAFAVGVGGDAPEGIWDRMLAQLEEAPPPLRLVPAGGDTAGARPEPAAPASIRRLRLATALVVAASLLVAMLGVRVITQDGRLDRLQDQVEREGVSQALLAAQADPSARRVQLASADGSVRAEALVLPDGRGWVHSHNLPALDDGRMYQLWGASATGTVSLGVLGADPGIIVFEAAMPDLRGFAITAETTPVERSQQPFVVSGFLGQTKSS